jgi:tyrosine-protein kinase Etk/Wzc
MNATVSDPIPLHRPRPVHDFFVALWQRRFPVLGFILVMSLLAAGLAMTMKPWFTASATLLPPTEGGNMFENMSGMIESAALSRVGLLSTSTPSDIYVEILKSRRLREALINKFDLQTLYDMKGKMDGTLRELESHVEVKSEPSGLVTISVEDTDKHRAANMANFLVAELDRFNREMLQTRGKRTRQFLETRLAELKDKMAQSEARLTAYEKANKVVVATDESAVRGIADVMSQKLSLQVRRSYIEAYSAPNSPAVRELDAEIQAFERELARLPGLKNEGARLALDTEIQRKLFTFLTAQYEDARVQEMKDTPTVTVLDEARAPDVRSRPRRTIMVLITGFIATLAACGWVYWQHRREMGV